MADFTHLDISNSFYQITGSSGSDVAYPVDTMRLSYESKTLDETIL